LKEELQTTDLLFYNQTILNSI